jgi:hypothetical protein
MDFSYFFVDENVSLDVICAGGLFKEDLGLFFFEISFKLPLFKIPGFIPSFNLQTMLKCLRL